MQLGTRRINVNLTIEEREALRTLAQHEFRDPREQVRYMLQQEFIKRGFLSTNANIDTSIRQDAPSLSPSHDGYTKEN